VLVAVDVHRFSVTMTVVVVMQWVSMHRRRLVINIGGQKFGSQILGGQKFRENIFSDNILKKNLKNILLFSKISDDFF